MLIRKLFRTAWKYKAQFFSMILMVTIGVGIFLGFNIEWRSLEYDTEAFLTETKYADYRLYLDSGFSEEQIEKIQQIDGVEAATRFLSVNASVKDSTDSLCLNVSENYTVSVMQVMEGAAYDDASDGIWLSDRYAAAHDLSAGDTIELSYLGKSIKGEIAGLVKSGEMMICVADSSQLMPDYDSFGFAYISPNKLKKDLNEVVYPQVNLISDRKKADLEEAVKETLGQTVLVTSKDEHMSYMGVKSETEEGKTMGSILPVLFLAIGILTMITTMHRIAANEKVQIGTLKALGFRDKRILRHYTSYGLFVGLAGTALGILLGYAVAAFIISPSGMMATYLDLPDWKLVMPGFCIPVMGAMVVFLTFISYLSVKKMLKGTASDALRPYTPKAMKKSVLESIAFLKKLSFGTKWNIRDTLRHKARSGMTLLGVVGCVLLLIGGLGMKDTMKKFLELLDDDISNYKTSVSLSEQTSNEAARTLAEELEGDWMASAGISYEGETVTMEIYDNDKGRIGFLKENGDSLSLSDEGVYLCLRLKDTAEIGDTIEISPYGSEETYQVKVAGYLRSMLTECIVMTDSYADRVGIPYRITTLYTDYLADEIDESGNIAEKKDKDSIMDTYDTFMEIMNTMVEVFVIAAVVLGIVVLYNLGIMSYVERSRELATLKVLGFRDKWLGRLLISQNVWLTVLGVCLGIPFGVLVLKILIIALADEYEMMCYIGAATYGVSTLVTFGVSFAVGFLISKKNKDIDMVEALKGAE